MSINRVLILGVLLLLQVLLIARCQEVAMSEATEQADLETASVEVDAATGGSEYEQAEAAATELPRKTSPPTIYEELLGDSLYVWGSETNPDGTKKEETVYEMYTSELMKDVDVVALYFSASW